MKLLLKFVIVLLVFSAPQTSEAQFLKKLKDKAVKAVSGKENDEEAISENPTFGSVIITHSNTYGSVDIPEISKIKVNRNDENYKINGSWWSHDADIHDGFVLTIKTTDDLRHDTNQDENVKRTFKIPEEATLKLSYDPVLPHYKESEDTYKKAVTDDYQTYNVSKGEVTIDVLSEEAIQISFSGRVSLKKIVRHSNNSEDYSETYFESTVKGGIDGNGVEYYDNLVGFYHEPKEEELSTSTTSEYDSPSMTTAKPGVYQFTFETKVRVTTSEQNRSFDMSYLLNPNEKYMGIMVDMSAYSDEDMADESVIIMDKGNSHFFVETAGMKMQMSQNMMGGNQMSNPTDQMANYDYTKLKKTGNSKTVLGAKCYEYIMSDNDVKMNLWVAPDVNLPNWFIQNDEVLKGHIMEYTIESKDGNMKSETIAINDNINKTINPKDYKKMF